AASSRLQGLIDQFDNSIYLRKKCLGCICRVYRSGKVCSHTVDCDTGNGRYDNTVATSIGRWVDTILSCNFIGPDSSHGVRLQRLMQISPATFLTIFVRLIFSRLNQFTSYSIRNICSSTTTTSSANFFGEMGKFIPLIPFQVVLGDIIAPAYFYGN